MPRPNVHRRLTERALAGQVAARRMRTEDRTPAVLAPASVR